MTSLLERFIYWCRRHRVTGVEVIQVPLLAISIATFLTVSTRQTAANILFRAMAGIAPLWFWAVIAGVVLGVKVSSILLQSLPLMRLSLAMAASWWFTLALLIFYSVRLYLAPAVWASFGFAALWRIADLAIQESERPAEDG